MRKATPPRPNAAWLPVAPDSPWTLIPCCSGRRVRPLTDTAKRAPPPRPRGGGKGRPLELTAAGDCALQLALAHLRAALDSKALRLAVELLLGELGGHPSPFRLGPGAASALGSVGCGWAPASHLSGFQTWAEPNPTQKVSGPGRGCSPP